MSRDLWDYEVRGQQIYHTLGDGTEQHLCTVAEGVDAEAVAIMLRAYKFNRPHIPIPENCSSTTRDIVLSLWKKEEWTADDIMKALPVEPNQDTRKVRKAVSNSLNYLCRVAVLKRTSRGNYVVCVEKETASE